MTKHNKKHACPDCNHCQWCSDDRCRLCLRPESGCQKKLSIKEQIAFFEQLNRTAEECKLSHLDGTCSHLDEDGHSPGQKKVRAKKPIILK